MWQCCQTELYFVIPSVLGPRPSVSWLASAHPLEVWHPLHSDSICQRSLCTSQLSDRSQLRLLNTAYRQRSEEDWRDDSGLIKVGAHKQTFALRKPDQLHPSSWRYFGDGPLFDESPPPTLKILHSCLLRQMRRLTHGAVFISPLFLLPLFMWVSFVLLPSMHFSRHGGGVFWFCRQTALLRAGGRAKKGGWASAQMDD